MYPELKDNQIEQVTDTVLQFLARADVQEMVTAT
jgi:hypothetical protein